jgi:hypothetical protein
MHRITLNEQTADGVDIYAVGVQYELGFAYNLALHGMWREGWGRLKRIPGMWGRRNAWNGYLAEPLDSSRPFTRAGHAWTRRRALADLRRHVNAHSMQES